MTQLLKRYHASLDHLQNMIMQQTFCFDSKLWEIHCMHPLQNFKVSPMILKTMPWLSLTAGEISVTATQLFL